MPPPLPTAQDQPHCLVSPRTKYMRLARLPLLLLLLLSPRGAVANTDMDDVEAQVRSFYAKHNPEKVSKVPTGGRQGQQARARPDGATAEERSSCYGDDGADGNAGEGSQEFSSKPTN